MTDPWDERDILPDLHENHKNQRFYVGKYTVRPMDPSWDSTKKKRILGFHGPKMSEVF